MRHLIAAFIISASSVAVGCGSGGPTTPSGSPLSITLSGPASIAPGATAQFHATEVDYNHNSSDATTTARWSSTAPTILEIQSDGVAIARARGEATITARSGVMTDNRRILVLEDGTFKLLGTVIDAEDGTQIAGAAVEVIAGTGTGLRAQTGANGTFALFGVAGPIRVRVSADRYAGTESDLVITAERVVTLGMFSDRVPGIVDLTGRWTLSLSAPGCTQLPEKGRSAQFAIDVTHRGTSKFQAMVFSGGFIVGKINGQFDGRNVTLLLPIIEDTSFGAPIPSYAMTFHLGGSFADSEDVGVHGTMRMTLDGAVATGTLDGALDLLRSGFIVRESCPGPADVVMRRE